MTQFKNLLDFLIKFGPDAQAALDFLSNKDNIRKFNALKANASSDEATTPQIDLKSRAEPMVCIALDNRRFVTKEEWENGNYTIDDVVGIAVRTPSTSFIIGMDEWFANWHYDEEELVTGNCYSSKEQALRVTSGLEDTRAIVSKQRPDSNTGPNKCWNYNHKGLQWYLPSLLELTEMNNHFDEINELMELVSDNLLEDVGYWSSAECSTTQSWCASFWADDISRRICKANLKRVRPVTSL